MKREFDEHLFDDFVQSAIACDDKTKRVGPFDHDTDTLKLSIVFQKRMSDKVFIYLVI